MKYVEFRDAIREKLLKRPDGMTWKKLRDELDLPYDRPCPNWVERLELDIGIKRIKGPGRALIWKLK